MRIEKGLTLVELLAVIVVMGILAGIAVPVYFHFMEEYKAEVNRVEMARLYKEYLVVEQIDHSPAAFVEFCLLRMDGDVCPVGGELTFVDGEVECGVHGDHAEDDGDDEVTYL